MVHFNIKMQNPELVKSQVHASVLNEAVRKEYVRLGSAYEPLLLFDHH